MRDQSTLALALSLCAGCSWVAGADEKTLTLAPDAGDAGSRNDAGEAGSAGAAGTGGSSPTGYLDLDRPGRPPSRPLALGPKIERLKIALAMRRIYFGISVRGSEERDPDGWRKIGWDLDGLDTSLDDLESGQPGTCTSTARAEQLIDGVDGRDNVVGATLFQMLGTLDPKAENFANVDLGRGAATLMLVLEGIESAVDDPDVPGVLLVAASERTDGGPDLPWDGNDVRRISVLSYFPGSRTPITKFPRGYIRGGVWVSGDQPANEVSVVIPVYPKGKGPLPLRFGGRGGWLSVSLGEDLLGGAGTMGFTASKTETIDVFRDMLLLAGSCKNPTSTDNLLKAATDNLDTQLANPWSPDPKLSCDGLSWGLDTEWVRVTLDPQVVSEEFILPCPPP
jgi:hypothetical protein